VEFGEGVPPQPIRGLWERHYASAAGFWAKHRPKMIFTESDGQKIYRDVFQNIGGAYKKSPLPTGIASLFSNMQAINQEHDSRVISDERSVDGSQYFDEIQTNVNCLSAEALSGAAPRHLQLTERSIALHACAEPVRCRARPGRILSRAATSRRTCAPT